MCTSYLLINDNPPPPRHFPSLSPMEDQKSSLGQDHLAGENTYMLPFESLPVAGRCLVGCCMANIRQLTNSTKIWPFTSVCVVPAETGARIRKPVKDVVATTHRQVNK